MLVPATLWTLSVRGRLEFDEDSDVGERPRSPAAADERQRSAGQPVHQTTDAGGHPGRRHIAMGEFAETPRIHRIEPCLPCLPHRAVGIASAAGLGTSAMSGRVSLGESAVRPTSTTVSASRTHRATQSSWPAATRRTS